MRYVTRLAVVTWSCASLLPGAAFASGLSVARFGGEQGNPTTTNATAIYYNPSGIADAAEGHLYVDANLAWRHAVYERSVSPSDAPVPAGAAGANTGRASFLNAVVSPFAGATYKFGHLGVGAAFCTPFGGQSSWGKNDAFQGNAQYPGAVDGTQRWSSISGVFRSSFFSLAAAYDFGALSVGVSGNLIETTANVVRAREPAGTNDIRVEGRSWLDARGWDGSLGVGITYKPLPHKLRLGLSYQSRPGFGSGIRASGHLQTVFSNGRVNDNAVDFTTDLPHVVRVGAAYRPTDDVELRLSGDYQTWSVLENQCVLRAGSACSIAADGSAVAGNDVIINLPRNWQNTFGVRAGASYWASARVELLAGVGYGSNAIPDRTYDPALLDANVVTVSAGGAFSVASRLKLGVGYMQAVYLPRDTVGKSATATLLAPSRSPDAGGKYSVQAGIVTATADFTF